MSLNPRIMKALTYRDFSFEKVPLCPVCNISESLPWSRNPIEMKSCSIRAVRCAKCSLVYCDHRLDENSCDQYYQLYATKRDSVDPALAAQRTVMHRYDFNFLVAHSSRLSRILDVGCSDGGFLSLFDGSILKYGIEVDQVAASAAREKVPNFNLIENLSSLPDAKTDLIIFRGTLQYQRELRKIVRECLRVLSPSGRIALLANPNPNAPVPELARENWGLFDPIEHLAYFTPMSIETLFDPLEIITQDYPYLGSPYANPNRDLENFTALARSPETSSGSFPFWGSISNTLLGHRRERP